MVDIDGEIVSRCLCVRVREPHVRFQVDPPDREIDAPLFSVFVLRAEAESRGIIKIESRPPDKSFSVITRRVTSGNLAANLSSPVPSGIAAVTATILSSFSARS